MVVVLYQKKKVQVANLNPPEETRPSFHCNPAAQSDEMLSQGGRGKVSGYLELRIY